MQILTYSPQTWELPDTLLEPARNQVSRLVGPARNMVRQIIGKQPDLVLLSGFRPDDPHFLGAVEQLCLAVPTAAVVVLQPKAAPEQLLSLMRAGVREVIDDTRPDTIREVIDRAQLRSRGGGTRKARVFGFVSSKGGDGSSCIAANLAYALSREPDTRVLAVDISLPFGDLDMYLTPVSHPQDLADISSQCSRLDQSLLSSMVQHLSPSLDLIPSPATFDKIVGIEPKCVSQLIAIAEGYYDYIVLDLGSSLDQVGIWVLEELEELCIITAPSLPSLRRAGQLLNLWNQFEKPISRIEIILNRADTAGRISREQIEKLIGSPISKRFPSDAEAVHESLLAGRPFLQSAPRSKLSKAVVDWADQLTGRKRQPASLWERLKIK